MPNRDWATFEPEALEQFSPPNEQMHARNQLARLQQTGSVRNYASKFMELCMRISDLSDDERLDWFLLGLKKAVRVHTALNRGLVSLADHIAAAEAYDSIMWGEHVSQPSRP